MASNVNLFEDHSREVYAWAYRLLGRHHDALDVVQDVFLRWTRQCGQEVPAQPRGWLRRVTINRAVDFCRRRLALQPELERPAEPQSRGIEAADEEAFRSDVAAAFDGLTEVQRSVLVGKLFDGLTFAALATELDIAVSTAKTHYLRAIRTVRNRLAPRWADEA